MHERIGRTAGHGHTHEVRERCIGAVEPKLLQARRGAHDRMHVVVEDGARLLGRVRPQHPVVGVLVPDGAPLDVDVAVVGGFSARELSDVQALEMREPVGEGKPEEEGDLGVHAAVDAEAEELGEDGREGSDVFPVRLSIAVFS